MTLMTLTPCPASHSSNGAVERSYSSKRFSMASSIVIDAGPLQQACFDGFARSYQVKRSLQLEAAGFDLLEQPFGLGDGARKAVDTAPLRRLAVTSSTLSTILIISGRRAARPPASLALLAGHIHAQHFTHRNQVEAVLVGQHFALCALADRQYPSVRSLQFLLDDPGDQRAVGSGAGFGLDLADHLAHAPAGRLAPV